MAMNKLMHPNNPYKTPPDFKQLALLFPEFRKFAKQDLSGKVDLNFKLEGAVWALTSCLLKKDFGLDVRIVPSHLVPTLPLRLNYILWLSDILKLFKLSQDEVHGIDIGTGACCIYPLVAAKLYSWNMIGTEVDEVNFKCAQENLQRNNLQNKVKVQKVEQGDFLCGVVNEDESFDFCMCNPPFHDETDADNSKPKSRSDERPGPRNAKSGVNIELSTQGGEVAFVKSIIDESVRLKDQIRVYTTMLGHKKSLAPLKQKIKESCNARISSTMFCQGRTTRWGLAWTFMPEIDLDKADIQRLLPKKKDEYIRFQDFKLESDHEDFKQKLMETFVELEIEHEHTASMDDLDVYEILARKNTWINNRKKRREEKRKQELESNSIECGSKRKIDDEESPHKKPKIDSLGLENNHYLKCSMAIKRYENVLRLEMILIDGTGGKDALNQLLQFLKNRIK